MRKYQRKRELALIPKAPTPASIALAVRGHSVLSYFGWNIVSRLNCRRYAEEVLNIQVFSRRQSPTSCLVFVKNALIADAKSVEFAALVGGNGTWYAFGKMIVDL